MRSKVAKRIQDETPEEVRIFVRQYTDIVVRINQIIKKNPLKNGFPTDLLNKKQVGF